jgi:hypothetical protein
VIIIKENFSKIIEKISCKSSGRHGSVGLYRINVPLMIFSRAAASYGRPAAFLGHLPHINKSEVFIEKF